MKKNYKLSINRIVAVSIIIAFCSIGFNSKAQALRYDDIYKQLPNLSPLNAFSLLYKFQQQDPYFSNTYIQLGHVSEQMFKNIDPLREFEYLNYWSNNAVLYYGLFPVYLQANEVRRTREYYTNLPIAQPGKKIENEDVLAYISQRLEFCKNFKDSTTTIFETLRKSKDHYNSAVRTFNEINDRFENYNEALLQTNPEYLGLLASLKNDYAESINKFNEYQKIISTFPIGKYNQTYKIRNIETFRLDGLTNSDFLKDTFDIWNYDKWADEYLEIYNKEIVPLRQEINSINRTFADNKRRISLATTLESDTKLKSFDELFLFKLGKYDNSSLVRELFKYLDSRQDFLTLSKSELNQTTDSTTALMSRKVRYYNRLAMQYKSANENLQLFNKAIVPEKIKRFNDFFMSQYQGEPGLKNFYRQESEQLSRSFDTDLSNFASYLEAEQSYRNSMGMASAARGVNIPLYPIDENSPEYAKTSHVTQFVSYAQGLPNYVAGFIKRPGNVTMAFVAKIDKEKKIEWLREIGAKGKDALPSGDKAPYVFGYDNGCVVIVSGFIDSKHRNTLVRLDNNGKELNSTRIAIELAPAYLNFDEIGQQSIMAFGRNYSDNPKLFNSYVVCQTDSVGNLAWSNALDLQGQILEILKADNKLLVFANYEWYSIEGQRKTAGLAANSWSHALFTFSTNGSLLAHKQIETDRTLFINRIFTLSSTEFNLVSLEDSPGNRSSKMKYLIVSPLGEKVFSNY